MREIKGLCCVHSAHSWTMAFVSHTNCTALNADALTPTPDHHYFEFRWQLILHCHRTTWQLVNSLWAKGTSPKHLQSPRIYSLQTIKIEMKPHTIITIKVLNKLAHLNIAIRKITLPSRQPYMFNIWQATCSQCFGCVGGDLSGYRSKWKKEPQLNQLNTIFSIPTLPFWMFKWHHSYSAGLTNTPFPISSPL